MQEKVHHPGGVKELLAIAFPLIVSQSCETLMMFTDRVFLSRLGPEYMSAAMGGGVSCFVFVSFFVGLTGYANALVAQYLGADQPRRCGLAAGQAILVALAAYPLVLACIPVGHWMFRAMGLPLAERIPQDTYFQWMMVGSLIGLLRGAFSSFFSGIGRTRVIMMAAAVSLIVNVGSAYVLIFGKLGFPALGIQGAALGTIFAGACGITVLVANYFRRSHREIYGTAAGLKLDRTVMAKLWRFGFPSGLELVLNLLAFNLLILAFHAQGLAVAAAVTVAFNWDMVSFIPLIGLNIGVASLTGRFMGAQKPDLAHRATLSGVRLVCFHSLILILLFSLLPGPLVSLFLDPSQGEPWHLAVTMVRLVSVYVFADALGLVYSGALRGAGDTFATMCISVGAHYSLLLMTLFMLRTLQMTPEATWTILVGLVWMMGGAFYLRFRSGRWRSMTVVESKPLPDDGGQEIEPA